MIPPPEIYPSRVPENEPFWDYSDLFMFIMLLFASFGVLLVAVLLLRFTALAVGWKLLLPQLVFYAFALSSLAAILRFRYNRPLWRSLGWNPTSLTVTLSTLFAGPLLAISVGLISTALKTPDINLPFQQMLGSPGTIVLLGIVVVIFGPVCEELAFRGFLMPLVIRSLGAAAGVVITSVIFGCMHGYEYEWSWRHILLISLVGTALGWVKYKTQSTAAAAFLHSTYNLAQFAGFLWQTRTL
jgi:CAAX protease family protein